MLEFTREDLRKLIARQEQPCVSIYTPLHLDMPGALHNPVPFKKLLSDAEKAMLAAGHSASRVNKVVQPGRELLADYGFWQHRSAGLAAFLSPYGFYRFRLPTVPPEKLVVAGRFYTKLLLPLLQGDGAFCILAMSQNEVRLIQATHRSEQRLDLKKVPANMDDALQYQKLERQLQLHTYANPSSAFLGTRTGVFHTQGAPPDEKKEDVSRYMEILAKAVSERLQNDTAPLMLAAVEYLHPMFHAHCTYPHLIPEGLHGNPETLSDMQLREQAWGKVQPVFSKARMNAMKRYDDIKASPLASNDPLKVIPAAYNGAVDTLFADVDVELWGRFDAENNTVELHKDMQPGDVDLLDAAATQTLLQSGVVYGLRKEDMPNPSPLTALFRYPV
ncbi:MAG TPA: hypothetical protein VGL38_14360 [bacterium]|jgi:hypothetical protein